MDAAGGVARSGSGTGGAGSGVAAFGAAQPHHYYPPYPTNRWTFTQGLVVGQISMVIIALLLIRYVIFEDSATALEKERLMRLKISERRSKRHAKALLENAKRLGTTSKLAPGGVGAGKRGRGSKGDARATFAEILDKIGYDISTHGSESCDWLNVVLAQAVAGYREDVLAGGVSHHPPSSKGAAATAGANGSGAGMNFGSLFGGGASASANQADQDSHLTPEKERTARDLMEEILNRSTSKAGSFLDPIRVTEADFGDAYPIFTNARVRPADDTGRVRIEVDVDYSDQITLAIDTKLLVNFPKPRFAVLPVSISLTIVRFSGTLAVELFSSDPNATVLPSAAPSRAEPPPRSRHQLHFSLHPDFALEASASSLLGSRAKLQDIPKIEQLLISRLRGWIMDRFVWPRYWSLTLPNLVPGPSAEAADAGATADDGSGALADGALPGEMSIGTGVEGTRHDGIVEPGHVHSSRQEEALQRRSLGGMGVGGVNGGPASASLYGSQTGHSPAVGSVEAWRTQTLLSGVPPPVGGGSSSATAAAAAAAAIAAANSSGRPSPYPLTANSSASSSFIGGIPGGLGGGNGVRPPRGVSHASTPSLAALNGLRDSAVDSTATGADGSTRGLRQRSSHLAG